MTMLLTRTSSTTLPRPRVDLMRMPRSVPSNVQLEIAMFRTPPVISLPIDHAAVAVHHRAVGDGDVLDGTADASAPALREPDLIVMQSSPTLMWQSEMCTLRDESGLMPSVLGESSGLSTVTPRMVTSSQATGLIVQNGGFFTRDVA